MGKREGGGGGRENKSEKEERDVLFLLIHFTERGPQIYFCATVLCWSFMCLWFLP